MKAVVHNTYGSLDLLSVREISQPAVNSDEVLIRVHAAGLHVGDCFAVRGSPFAVRLVTGVLKPKRGIPGFDVAGEIERVGSRVTRFRPGDGVFGACQGSCAEYVSTSEATLVSKPGDLTFVEAAALSTSGLAALHALRDVGKVQPGQKILINGASGGVGTFAVQIAKALGAEVAGVCSSRNVDMVRSIGADRFTKICTSGSWAVANT
jgi:NADPH:quinone reductase-like Zn-dependent oxidoreductase